MISAKVTRKEVHDAEKGIKKGIFKAVEEIALAIEGQAVLNAPSDSGILRQSITHTRPSVSGGDVEAFVGSNLVYARIREEGGTIKAKGSGYLRFKTKAGNWVTTKSVTQQAANGGKGYLKPAVQSVKAKLSAIVGKYIRIGIRSS